MKFGILEKMTRTIPGDERSKTNPGHGYPEHTERMTVLHEFDDEEQMSRWMNQNIYKNIRIIQFEEMEFQKVYKFIPKSIST